MMNQFIFEDIAEMSWQCYGCRCVHGQQSFIYQAYNLNISNSFAPLAGLPCDDSVFMNSVTSPNAVPSFQPQQTSSPINTKRGRPPRRSNQSNNTKLNRVQHQAARFCKNNYIREEGTVTRLIEELNWQPLEVRRKIKKCTMIYKIHHGLVDISLPNHLVYQTRETRGHNKKLRQIRYKTNRYGDSFFPSTIPIWNNLPASAVNAVTSEAFKNQVTKVYIN